MVFYNINFVTKKLVVLSLVCLQPLIPKVLAGVTGGKSLGTFQNPSIYARPKFRYWIPDASVNHSVIASDVRAAGEAGAGGLECLGFYLYGGPPWNGGAGVTAPVSWATYGFGTDEWNSLFKSMVQSTKDNNLIIDFAIGPNQGTGVPADINSDGLMWDLDLFNATVPIEGSFNAVLPGWGTGTLEAAITGLVIKSEAASSASPGLPGDYSEQRTQYTLAADSLKDVTSQVNQDGHLSVSFSSTEQSGLYNVVFAIYLVHSHWRAQDGPKDIGGPQTPAYTIAENGSWAVGHFSQLGAQTSINFWEQNILQNGTKELLQEVGNYGWEDSIEIQSNIFWTKGFQKYFSADHGYSISSYIPVLLHRNGLGANSNPSVWYITDESDNGLSHIADFRATLAAQYRKYTSTLSAWARDYLGLKFSAQVSYNLPMDMIANVPSVDVPECESLDFSDLIDGYRQYSGAAHLAGKPVVSSECGAVPGEAYTQTLPELLWKVKRSYVGSINQFVFHGFPHSGNYGNTTWPVYTTFNYKYSDMHGPHQPAWTSYRQYLDFVARGNFILQTGTLRRDVAFWQKKTIYYGHTQARTYVPNDLEVAGYTYEYLSPDNFDLPNAEVRNHVLAPDAQAFKALVLRANDSLTVEGALKLASFAQSGLPIIFSGGVPTSYLGTNNPASLKAAQKALNSSTSLPNVYVTSSPDGLADKLASIGVVPAAKFEPTAPSWYTLLRSDAENGIDYYFVYNDEEYSPLGEGSSSATIEFSSTGYPYAFDAWTGEQTPVLTYNQSKASTTIPITLAGNQSTIIAFSQHPLTNDKPVTHFESLSNNVINSTILGNGSILLKATAGSLTYTTANGGAASVSVPNTNPLTLTNWNLTVEHWDPPTDLLNIEGGAVKYNTSHFLPNLVSWQQVQGLQNVSGRGFYSTTFKWPLPSSNLNPSIGAIIDFRPVVHTLSVQLNGHTLPPLDVTSAKADISELLVVGENTVLAEVATPLGNVLRTVWDQLKTSGTGPADPADGTRLPDIGNYGLIKDAIVQPYWNVVVD